MYRRGYTLMFLKKAVTLITTLYGLLAIFPNNAEGKLISLYWSGHITDIVSFGPEAVPSGISQGDLIRGSLTFETLQYSSISRLYGNVESGYLYQYKKGLKQTIYIETWKWVIKGADIRLIDSLSYPQRAFDVFSTSEDYYYDSFPNYVGTFEYGFALFDSNSPLELFDSYQIENLHLALDEVSSAGGFLSTRLWDNNGDIINGYYIDFEIDQTSYIPIAPNTTQSDLVITAVSNIPVSKMRGGKFTVKDIVKNQGNEAAGQFTNGYYLSVDQFKSDDDIAIESTRNISFWEIGKSSSKKKGIKPVKVKIPANTPLGKYYLIVCADSENLITESDETNNCKTSKKRIRVHK
jgi:hypothetical protein